MTKTYLEPFNMEKKSFFNTTNATAHIVFLISALGMVAVSIYLTSHYFEVKYPTGLGSGSLCNFNSFFNCDVATHSHASNIFGVPISLLGLLLGVFLLFGYLFRDQKTEGTNGILLVLNAIGCLGLFFFSLIFLGGLCPFCTVYYIFSWIALFFYYKNSQHYTPHPMPIVIYAIITLAVMGLTYNNIQKKEKSINALSDSLIKQFKGLPNLGKPDFDSEYRLASAAPNFSDAPIQITKFSDFECPACKMLSEILHELSRNKKYQGKMNIQYFFYPLDNACNEEMKRPLHNYACKASYLAACAPSEKFSEIEENFFQNQARLEEVIEELSVKYNAKECMAKSETKEKIVRYIRAAKKFNVRSTPTFLLNGVKIEGSLPVAQISVLLDEILRQKGL
jgi:protein-disulfide isomerase/uncharacterized membrane protein